MIKKLILLNLLVSSALYAHPIEDDSKEEIKTSPRSEISIMTKQPFKVKTGFFDKLLENKTNKDDDFEAAKNYTSNKVKLYSELILNFQVNYMSPDFILSPKLHDHALRVMKILNEGKQRVQEKYNKFIDFYDNTLSSETKNMQGGLFIGKYSGELKDDPNEQKKYAEDKAAIWIYVTKFFDMYGKSEKKQFFEKKLAQTLKRQKLEIQGIAQIDYKKSFRYLIRDKYYNNIIDSNYSLKKLLSNQHNEIISAFNGTFKVDTDALYRFAFEHQKKWEYMRDEDDKLNVLNEYNFENPKEEM